MTSTPEDGETLQQRADQPPTQTDLPDQTEQAHEQGDELELPDDNSDELTRLEPQDAGDNVSDIESVRVDAVLSPTLPGAEVRVQSPSVDDTASIPDDSPSVQGSLLSSPALGPVSPRPPTHRKTPSTPRRPFDLRFQSRLSSSSLLSHRASSPAFLASHSRQSSLASFGLPSASEPDDSVAPWEVIRWHKMSKLTSQTFSEAARRNFGSPTCLAVTDQIIIGTSKGIVLAFDHKQNHRAIIGPGTKAIECGPVTALAVSADHTAVAVGHATGHIFTWEINRPARPFLHIPPIDISRPEARSTDGHVDGSTVLHIGFLGFRRTALASADGHGMAFSHLASRGTGALGRTVKTTRVLGRYPDLVTRGTKPVKKSSVLAFSPLPLGNIEQSTDSLGLVAMLTPYLLVIVSTTPIAQTQHKAARPKDVAAHSAMTAALAWFPAIKLKGVASEVSKSKLAYAWSDVLTVLDVHEVASETDDDKDNPPELQFLPRSRYKSEEAIVAVQWLSRSVMAVLTITQQLLIIEDGSMTVTDAFDLLPKDLFHADMYSDQLQAVVENLDEADASMHGVVADAYHMSFRAYKGRLFLLGHKNVWWGSLTNWADRLLAMMDAGDFIGAIQLATNFYAGIGEKLTIGLPEDDQMRTGMVREKLLEMMSASLKYAFGKNQMAGTRKLNETQLIDLAVACVAACLALDDRDFMFDEVFTWYDDHEKGALFVDVLEPHILDAKVTSLPPTALKTLINHFTKTHTAASLEEIICLLDPTSMDIDQITALCKQHHLWDAYIYVWNSALRDYVSPLQDLLDMVPRGPQVNGHTEGLEKNRETAHKIFAYMSFVLTGRVYPTGLFINDDTAAHAKLQIYDFLFSGSDRDTRVVNGSGSRSTSPTNSFPGLRAMLNFDISSFMSALNEAFEDSYLNTNTDDDFGTSPSSQENNSIYTRQYLIQILDGVLSDGFDASQRIYLDMFIARNLPKYPQYMLLPGSVLQDTFLRLCQPVEEDLKEDAQLSVEYLLSVYQPPEILGLAPILREAGYYRVLKGILKQEGQIADLIQAYFLDEEQMGVFDVILQALRSGSRISAEQRSEAVRVVKDSASNLCDIDVVRAATVVDAVLPKAHQLFLDAQQSGPQQQFRYLRALIEPDQTTRSVSTHVAPTMVELYVRLMCQYDATHVATYVKGTRDRDIDLESVLPAMEAGGIIDAAVILMAKQGQVRASMDRLLKHLGALQGALKGILDNAGDSPDAVGTNEAIEDLVESVNKYAGVGIWICQGQSKAAVGTKTALKSPRRSSAHQPLSFDETLWLDLIVTVVSVAQDVSPPSSQEGSVSQEDEVQNSVRQVVQRIFTALLTSTTSAKEGSRAGNDFSFLRILRAFLTSAAESSPSLSQLRNVISSIFSAYAYEKSLLALSNAMLDKDLFVHVDEVAKLRQQGWRPRGQICEICRRRVWGPGTGQKIWSAWQRDEKSREQRRNAAFDRAGGTTSEPDLSRGKGRATASASIASSAATSSPVDVVAKDDEHDDKDTTANDDLAEATRTTSDTSKDVPGPIVVFSCRHLYHRACLNKGQHVNGITGETGHDHEHRNPSGGAGIADELTSAVGVNVGINNSEIHLRCPSCP